MKNATFLKLTIVIVIIVSSCRNADKKEEVSETKVSNKAPVFNGDSAFLFVQKQVDFGPRVPGTAASKKFGKFLVAKCKAYGLTVTEQDFVGVQYDNTKVPSKNIIAAYNPNATKRILLAAHYDSRPYSDKDPGLKTRAIDGANDGASGVAVLLEIARLLKDQKLAIGVDFLFLDNEDWGAPDSYTKEVSIPHGGYCVGSEYWSKNLHKAGYSAYYGILLDMVGASDAQFRIDQFSSQVAPSVAQNVWDTANNLGFGRYFLREPGAGITDDHVPINTNAKIPMIDIIDNRPTNNTFFVHHHTLADNIKTIDKNTLAAVGQTVLQILVNE